MFELSPTQLLAEIGDGEAWTILDVREDDEVAVSMLPDAIHIAMGEVPARVEELRPHRKLAIICRAGSRSARVAHFLESQGFSGVANVTGGMQAWAREIDPGMPVA